MAEEDVKLRWKVDASELQSETTAAARTLNDLGKAGGKAGEEVDKGLSKATKASKALDGQSEALLKTEQALAREVRSAREALSAKADALGLTRTEAKKLEKQMAALNDEAGESSSVIGSGGGGATKAVIELDDGLKNVGETAGDTESSLRAISGAIGMVSPEAEGAINVVAELSGGLEGLTRGTGLLGGSMGTLTTVVGGASVGLGLLATAAIVVANETAAARAQLEAYQTVIKDTTAETRALTASQNALRLATGEVDGFIGNLEVQTALLNGELTEAERLSAELAGELGESLRPELQAAGQAFAENEARIAELRDSIASGTLNFKEMAEAQRELGEAQDASKELADNLEAIKDQSVRGRLAINDYANAVQNAAEKEEDAKEGAKAYKVELREVTRAAEDLKKQQEALAAAFEESFFTDYLAGLDQALFGTESLSRSQKTVASLVEQTDALVPVEALDRVTRLELLLVQLETEAARAGTSLEMALGKEAVERSPLEESLIRVNEELTRGQVLTYEWGEAGISVFDSLSTAANTFTQLYIDQQAASIETTRARLDAIRGLEDDASKEERKRLRQSLKEQQKAAAKAFKIQQGIAVAEAIVNGLLAAQKALTLGPIAGPIAAAAIGVLTAANIAAIAAQQPPEFRAGGMVGGPSDNTATPIVAHSGEFIVNQQGVNTLGADTLAAANSGRGGGGQSTTVNLVVGNQTAETITVMGLSKGGAARDMTRSARSRGRSNRYTEGVV